MIVESTFWTYTLKDSAADSKLKLLKKGETFGVEKPGGEKRLHLGSINNQTSFDNLFFPGGKDEVLFQVFKIDLIQYLLSAKDEYSNPVQNYRMPIRDYYSDLLEYIWGIKNESFIVPFVKNVDSKRYYLSRPTGDPRSKNYDFISKICLPLVTKFKIIRNKNDNNTYDFYLKPIFVGACFEESEPLVFLSNFPLQQIYYGAPGTGKSHTVNKIVEGATVFRTTFHPDSDYSTFVGAYKPIEVESPVTHVVWDSVANIAKSFPVVDQANHPVLEKKITYKYVQQAFTKAYIEAWKRIFEITRLSVASPMPSASVSGSAASSASSGTNSISRMTDAEIVLIRRIMVKKSGVQNKWNKWFQNGTYSPVSNPSRSGDSDYCAATDLVHNNADDSCRNKDAFDEAWKRTIDKLRADAPQTAKNPNSNGKEYSFSADEVNDEWIWAESRMTKGKEILRGYWSGSSVAKGIEKDIIGKLRELDDDFDKAWDKLKPEEDGLGNSIDTGFDNFGANDKGRGEIIISRDVDSEEGSEDESIAFDPVFLVIEEINRGNCAQIFGDIFQLLDRNDDGFSVYPIMPDQDLSNELKNSFAACDVSPDVKDYINRMYKDGDVVRKVLTGEVLVIPASLSILATMNTSDQSLFPMDSAFKRRWDWIYEPIVEGMQVDEQGEKSDSQTPLGWKIEVDDTHSVDWWKFLQKINAVISSLTSSEDKQLGYFFCRPDSNDGITISKKRFVGKVVFYLWNEIFKDYAFEHDVCKKDADGKKETLYFADFYEGKNNINQTSLVTFFKHLDENQPKIDNKDVKLIEMVPDASSAPKTPDGAETPTESDTEHAEETPDETPEA